MAPKPFPFPIGVGVDICRYSRIYRVLDQESDHVTRWARKIFTCQEWPSLWQKCYRTSVERNSAKNDKASLWIPGFNPITFLDTNGQPATWRKDNSHSSSQLPTEQHEAIPRHDIGDTRATLDAELMARLGPSGHPLPPLSIGPPFSRLLAQHLAGRWAAKEATIKAHHYRKLSMGDISILSSGAFHEHPQGVTNKLKVQALVAPEPTTRVVMDPLVAGKRGLCKSQSRFGNIYGIVDHGRFVVDEQPETPTSRKYFVRRTRVKDEEQQVAEISISHDGAYAVAVCMALDEPQDGRDTIEYTFDDGSGEPLHEPEWGDEGWLERGKDTSMDSQ